MLIIGAGAAGLAAANEAIKQGFTVKILEASARLGGRINTDTMGELKVDLGASWIHGIGPGCGFNEEWAEKENPIYALAKEKGIATVETWDDLANTSDNYYWYKGKDQELGIDGIVEKITQIGEFVAG